MDLLAQITTLVTRELDLPEEPPSYVRLLDEVGLDSAGLMALAFAIEREFGIELEEDEFTRANFESIDAIAGVNEAVAPSGVNLGDPAGETGAEEGFYQPDIIVVLTDGANSQGPLPLEAARYAADRQVRVYTIGFGTTNPQRMVCTRQQLGSDAFRGGFGGGIGPGFGGGFGGGGGFRRFLILNAHGGNAAITRFIVDRINQERKEHIVTVEDPIEFIHPNKGCLINQREVHADTHGFHPALRSVLRQDPDIVLFGELRDTETIEAALTLSETGHQIGRAHV